MGGGIDRCHVLPLYLRSLTLTYLPTPGRGGGGHLVGGGCTQFVHGRSRMTTDPRIPTMPGRSTSGFHQPGKHCLHQPRSAVRCSASRMKGELHPSKNRSRDEFRHLAPTFLRIDDRANELCFVFWCGHSRDSNGYYYVTASWVPYHVHTT